MFYSKAKLDADTVKCCQVCTVFMYSLHVSCYYAKLS